MLLYFPCSQTDLKIRRYCRSTPSKQQQQQEENNETLYSESFSTRHDHSYRCGHVLPYVHALVTSMDMSYNYHYAKALRELADSKQAPRMGMSHNYHYAKPLRELADGKHRGWAWAIIIIMLSRWENSQTASTEGGHEP